MKEKTKSKINIFYGATPETFKHARELRKNTTYAEKKLWEKLRNRNLKGYRFRRQHPIKYFIVDFYCHEAKTVIEFDGSIHYLTYNKEYDPIRGRELCDLGLKVLRFTNKKIVNDLETAVEVIANVLQINFT